MKADIMDMLNKARFHRNVTGRGKKAIRICDKILKIDPENRDAMLIKAGSLKFLGRFDDFLNLIDKIIKKWPDSHEAYYLKSRYYFMMQEDDKALQNIEGAVELGETFDNVMTYAQFLYLLGKDNYMEYVEKAKKIDKKRAENFMKNHWSWDV